MHAVVHVSDGVTSTTDDTAPSPTDTTRTCGSDGVSSTTDECPSSPSVTVKESSERNAVSSTTEAAHVSRASQNALNK